MRGKKLIAMIMALAVPTTTFAAVEKAELNILTNSIEIEGTVASGLAGKEVKIVILNPHDTEGQKYVLADLNDPTKFAAAHFVGNTVMTGDGGVYSYSVALSSTDKAGDYQVYIQDDDQATPLPYEIYFADDEYKKDRVKDINNETDAMTTEDAIKAAIKPLALDNALITEVGISNVARIVEEYVTPERKLDEESPANAATMLTKLIIAEAYNQSKTAIVYGAQGTDIQTNVTSYDFSADADFYSAYTTLLNDTGRMRVRSAMLAQGFTTPEDVTKRFCELVIIKGIPNAERDGREHIRTILTAANATRIGKNFDAYIALTDIPKSRVETGLMAKSYETIDEFMTELARLIAANPQITAPATPGGSSGGSSGGGISMPVGGVTLDEINENRENRSFTDLESVEWAREAIEYLYEKGMISGVGNKKFAPMNSLTREQFVVMLVNALGLELGEESTEFSDVVPGSYYAKHIEAARKAGIVNGISETIFGVGKELTRQDICTMIKRACFAQNEATGELSFTDKENISDYALGAIAYMSEAGIVNGFEDGSFAPKRICTRAQGAKILYETLKVYGI